MKTARGRVDGRSLFLSKDLFALTLCVAAARNGLADEAPKVTLERVVEGRGNRVCDVAKAALKHDNESRRAWVVRGLLRSDLILRREARKGANSGEVTVNEIRLDDHSSSKPTQTCWTRLRSTG